MNANRRKALAAAAVVRSKVLGLELDEALSVALEKAGVQVSEIERAGLQRDAAALYDRVDKPEQQEIAI